MTNIPPVVLSEERKSACVAAYVAGWRQDDNGGWWRPGTERDGFTLHTDDMDPDEEPFGYVLASTPEDALRIDRETFGRAA